MRFFSKIFLILVIIVPIIICFAALNDIWKDDGDEVLTDLENETAINDTTTKTNNTPNTSEGESSSTYQMGSEEFKSSIGAPTSKIVEGATVNVSVANVYLDPSETSEIVDTIAKHTVVTTQSFPNGWSRIKSSTVSGWVKSEYISLPDTGSNVAVGSVIGKMGTVNVTSLNVRASASTTATIKNTLTENTEVRILGVSGDNDWYRIQWNTLEGWVSSKYITIK